jgi:hypothetical protein
MSNIAEGVSHLVCLSTHFIMSSLILKDLLLAELYCQILIKGCALSGYLFYLHLQ